MGNATQARSGEPRSGRVPTGAEQTGAEQHGTDPADGSEHMKNAGPGWYYDPEDEAIYRYWDGSAWTDHRSDTVLSEIPS